MSGGSVRVLQTVEHRCGYYSDRLARNLVVDPAADHQALIYDMVVGSGFRRAGDLIFRPHCRQCLACEATRLPVDEMVLSRSQRRCLRINRDVTQRVVRTGYSDEYFELYQSYLAARHPGGGMDNPRREDFEGFLLGEWARTFFLELRREGRLLGVAVTDQLSSGYSAVYSFFDPDQGQRSLGTLSILAQAELVRRAGLPYLYLGYWIDGHPKMHYKTRFRPLELFRDGQWIRAEQNSG